MTKATTFSKQEILLGSYKLLKGFTNSDSSKEYTRNSYTANWFANESELFTYVVLFNMNHPLCGLRCFLLNVFG